MEIRREMSTANIWQQRVGSYPTISAEKEQVAHGKGKGVSTVGLENIELMIAQKF